MTKKLEQRKYLKIWSLLKNLCQKNITKPHRVKMNKKPLSGRN